MSQRPLFRLVAPCLALSFFFFTPAHGQPAGGSPGGARPSLVVTNDPVPAQLKQNIYTQPARTRDISPSEVSGRNYFNPQQTPVTAKINELWGELKHVQNEVSALSGNLNVIQRENEQRSAEYFSAVATINTQLQSGTTRGNPRLTNRLTQAQTSLDTLASSASNLNQIATNLSNAAAKTGFLMETARAAYDISGAVEEDHVMLAELEDAIQGTGVIVERVLNTVSDDITRTNAYISTERNNLRALSLAVANGDLYGKSLGQHPFSTAGNFMLASQTTAAPAPQAGAAPAPLAQQAAATTGAATTSAGMRPLVKIRFDRPNVDYQQPLYMAVNEALSRYPNAQFELVAVHPSRGNAAQVAIESTRSRRNAEDVLRTLTQLGLSLDRINLSYQESADAVNNEVHLYIR